MKIRNFHRILLLSSLFALLFFLTDCANIQTPSGGPKDSLPPAIINCIPLDMATNFKGKDVRIIFSEWPDRNAVVKNISISPPIELTFAWSGKKLAIEFIDKLKENTTYSLLLGTEYTDLAGNKPDSAFAVTFSTGSKIDSGKIDGMLYGEKVAGSFVYGYRTDNKNTDTLNIENTSAEYKTQVGANGAFSLRALPDGKYRLFAVKTEFKDNLFHPNSDFFGTIIKDIEVKSGNAPQTKIQITKYPNLQKNICLNETQIGAKLLEFSFTKPFSNSVSNINPGTFLQLIDSSSQQIIHVNAVFLDSIVTNKIILKLADTLLPDKQYTLNILDNKVLKDTFGLFLDNLSYSFQPKYSNRDVKFSQNYIPFIDSTRNVDYYKELIFNFNFPIKFDADESYFKLIKLSENIDVDFIIIQNSPNSLKIVPKMELVPDNWYRLSLNLGKIESIYGDIIKDTVLKYDFSTQDWRTYPRVSGNLTNQSGCKKVIVAIYSTEAGTRYEAIPNEKGDWAIPRVKPGKYLMEIYCDSNENGKYDSGLAFPFIFAENFVKFTNIIEVKERWDVENIKVALEE